MFRASPAGSLPSFRMTNFLTVIDSPADAAFLRASPLVTHVIETADDLRGLDHSDDAYLMACTGVPRGEVPVVPVAKLKHPQALSHELKELLRSGAALEAVEERIKFHLETYDRFVTKMTHISDESCLMELQDGKYAYALGIMQYCMNERLFGNIRSPLIQVLGLMRYFSDIVKKAQPQGHIPVMSNLLNELAAILDAKLGEGAKIEPAHALAIADLQSIAVNRGVYAMLTAEGATPSRDDALRSAAYLFDLMRRYEVAGAKSKQEELRAMFEIAPLREYEGLGHEGVLKRLDQEIAISAEDALRGYFDANKDVGRSVFALLGFWNARYAGAYLYRQHIYTGLSKALADHPEAAFLEDRVARDAVVAKALGLV
ncbi:MAG: hypothetical protein WC683_11600 [bacterium]